MTVRDGARYLAQSLASVRAQTDPDWELVLVDDASQDASLAIAHEHARADPRIRVIASPPVGRRRALVLAHQHARGSLLGWVDADDWLAPEAIARCRDVLARTRCDLVYTDHVIVDAAGTSRGRGRRCRIPFTPRRLLVDFMTFHFRLFTREVFERAGGIAPDRDIAIDYDLCLRIAEHGRIRHLAEPLYFYRHHEAQLSVRQRTAQIAASAAAIRASLARRGLPPSALTVDLTRGRFRLAARAPATTPPARTWPRIALATVWPRMRPAPAPVRRLTTWPGGRGGRYAEQFEAAAMRAGLQVFALGATVAALLRAVVTGRTGDALVVHGIPALSVAASPGSQRALGRMFLLALDHARARGTRIVWLARHVPAPHAMQPDLARWFRRELARRCDAIVAHAAADVDAVRALGAARVDHVAHPSLDDAYPDVSVATARAELGLAADAFHVATLPRGFDREHPRAVARQLAAADVVVLPTVPALESGAAQLALARGKPIVAPDVPSARALLGSGAALFAPTGGATAIADALTRARATASPRDDGWAAVLDAARGSRTAPLVTPAMRPRVAASALSVVIPLRDRAGADVRNALASLRWQSSGPPREVILVSHGSAPAIDAALHELARAAGATLHCIGAPEDPWCKALALNVGIRATDPASTHVMTMDADMILAENFVAEVLAALSEEPSLVLCQSADLPEGCAVPTDPTALRAALPRLARRATLRPAYGTGGIQAIARDFLVAVRGYDEDMTWWGAVDTDLVTRAEAAGLRIAWLAGTRMLHQWHPRKHRGRDPAAQQAARAAWTRNHQLMRERATDVRRNPGGWGGGA